MIANRGIDFEEDIRVGGAKWIILGSGSKSKRHCTRAQAVEVRSLLKKSCSREVGTPVMWEIVLPIR
jgi:hypothetical protein